MTSVELRRFGPIYRGEIDLCPLTILIGPNGSGKSYAAMVLHSLAQSKDQGNRPLRMSSPSYLADSFLSEDDILSIHQLESLENSAKELSESGKSSLDQDIFNEIVEYYYKIFFENRLNDVLEAVFATDIKDLIKKGGHRSFRIDVNTTLGNSRMDCYTSYDGLEIKSVPKVHSDVAIQAEHTTDPKYSTGFHSIKNADEEELLVVVPDFNERFQLDQLDLFMTSIIYVLQTHTDLRYQSDSHYLPAGRAGLLQSHEVLTTGAIDRLSRIGIEPIEVPAFSGVVSSYLSEIVSLSSKDRGELHHLANDFEKDIFDGKVTVERKDSEPHPTIKFEQNDNEFQLHVASTSVSELAPLILYTKFILSENSTIVIEEPEAHLHPENQRKIAYFIARLVKAGVRVIVTTHSDFFLEQINNLIRASEIGDDRREEHGLKDLPAISAEDVSANMFSYDSEKKGYRINSLEINAIDGVPLDEFGEVSEELYGEGFKIDSLLQDEINSDLE